MLSDVRPRPSPQKPFLRQRLAAATSARGVAIDYAVAALAIVLFGVHLEFSRPEYDLATRALLAAPILPAMWEFRRTAQGLADAALPMMAFGLLSYYVAFSLPALFQQDFGDLHGRVVFNDEVRRSGAIAVAVGSVALYAGMRAGEQVGPGLRRVLERVSPPAAPPSDGIATATLIYALVCAALLNFLNFGALPGALAVFASMTLSLAFAIGLAAGVPGAAKHASVRYLSPIIVVVGGGLGLLAGMLDPVVRLGMVAAGASWAYARRVSLRLVAGALAIVLVVQPVKARYRSEVWHGRGDNSYSTRVDAWARAVGDYWIDGRDTRTTATDAVVSRLGELDAVNHAFLVVGSKVKPLDGAGWLGIPLRWIPRVIWPDKPTTQDQEQRYAVSFGRQMEGSARTTAILLPLLVDGYWNLGWSGIVLGCVLVGFWVGLCQMAYTGRHWAVRAMGAAQFGGITVHGSLQGLYGGIFQQTIGPLLACWGVYWLALAFAQRQRVGVVGRFGRA